MSSLLEKKTDQYIVKNPFVRVILNTVCADKFGKDDDGKERREHLERNIVPIIRKNNLEDAVKLVSKYALNQRKILGFQVIVEYINEIGDLLIESEKTAEQGEKMHLVARKIFSRGVEKVQEELEEEVLEFFLDNKYQESPLYFSGSEMVYQGIPLSEIRYKVKDGKNFEKNLFEFMDIDVEMKKAAEIKDIFALYHGLKEMEGLAKRIIQGYESKDERIEFNKYYNRERSLIKAIYLDKVKAFEAKERNKVELMGK